MAKTPKFRSKFEERVSKIIPITYQYEAVRLPYVIETSYTPDWIDTTNKRIIEAKGVLDQETRRRMLAFQKAYPDYTVEFVFQNPNNPINKGSKTTYGDWATKNGFKWSTI